MSFLHQKMADGAWQKMALAEKMSNIGSEVHRALSWQEKGNNQYAESAFLRSLELFDFTLQSEKDLPKLKEIARLREVWSDYFTNGNTYRFTPDFFRKYFLGFNLLARR
ncbi:MAG: hypothetical protein WCS44_08660 [Bacillota bacterium]